MSQSNFPNPFYFLLLLVSFLFVATALAYAVIPVVEQNAKDAGVTPPPSLARDLLRQHGGKVLLGELVGIFLFGGLSMGLDRLRTLRQPQAATTMAPTSADPSQKVPPA